MAGPGLLGLIKAISSTLGAQLDKEIPEEKKPDRLSTEGIAWLFIAAIFDGANILFGFLDVVFLIGTVLAIVVNAIAMLLIGGWLYFRTGQLPILRSGLPFGLKSLPLVRFFPFWVFSVWTACK